MRWEFDLNEWESQSVRRDENDMELYWRINVCEDGTFDVFASDSELTISKECFATLQEAKDFCEKQEPVAVSLVRRESMIAIDDHMENKSQSVSAWFSKTLESRGQFQSSPELEDMTQPMNCRERSLANVE